MKMIMMIVYTRRTIASMGVQPAGFNQDEGEKIFGKINTPVQSLSYTF